MEVELNFGSAIFFGTDRSLVDRLRPSLVEKGLSFVYFIEDLAELHAKLEKDPEALLLADIASLGEEYLELFSFLSFERKQRLRAVIWIADQLAPSIESCFHRLCESRMEALLECILELHEQRVSLAAEFDKCLSLLLIDESQEDLDEYSKWLDNTDLGHGLAISVLELYIKDEKFSQALAMLNDLIEDSPDCLQLLQAKAKLYEQMQEFSRARLIWSELLSKQPDRAYRRHALALCEIKLENWAKALEHLNALESEFVLKCHSAFDHLKALAFSQERQELKFLMNTLEVDAKFASKVNQLAFQLKQKRQLEMSVFVLQLACRRLKDYFEPLSILLFNLSLTLIDLKSWQAAYEACYAVSMLRPDLDVARKNLASLQSKAEQAVGFDKDHLLMSLSDPNSTNLSFLAERQAEQALLFDEAL